MNVLESLESLSTYPVPENTIQAICVSRELDASGTFSLSVRQSKSYELCMADVYTFLSAAPNLSEQDISISGTDKKKYERMASALYNKHGVTDLTGFTYGYIGDDFNG